ncbi:hypothetical protein AB2M62_01350 [Sphingomonas sp. MMS12-HWE2-04]|uniref:hypothetical protein n=1 Tax=Sphingomonas sp. MMS12-HWE2-04 TaxID=3234199 RepID=UPI00384F1B54
MTADITRFFPDRDTRFHALVRQQGRLPIDAEENFASDLAEWERDDAFVETIAPSGSPDDGFRISLAASTSTTDLDLAIAPGSYYLGGARIENPGMLTYRSQRGRNWLTFSADAEGAKEAIGSARQFLVWLDAFDQTVTATEDAELRDPGLGGADGVAARRFGWHVRATPVTGPGCVLARQQWLVAMGWTGKVDPGTGALKSNAPLTVTFDPSEESQDLCAPALTPGFLGARNESYRVMISTPGRYVWGRDDAAPVYRVRVEAIGGQQRRIVFLTQPRDTHVRPRAGQTVELLRWDEKLPNGQKTAERVGTFFTVASGYQDGAITLTTTVGNDMLNWLSTLPGTAESAEDPVGQRRYFYLRLWSGGGSGSQPDTSIASGNLTGTGLSLTFDPTAMVGDHWVIAARPNAPSQMLPWALKTGALPHGPRRHVVPLAFVDLDAGTIIDCRRRFRPLYKQGGCCTVTVGDDENSWGDVSTIADAIARLPASGGEICIGPGTWRENIVLEERENIVFTGCGARTHWRAADGDAPLVTMTRCRNIRFRRLDLESEAAPCIVAGDPEEGERGSRDITIEDSMLATPSGGVVRFDAVVRLLIDRCSIESGPMADPAAANAAFAAITLKGSGLTVRKSSIRAVKGETAQTIALAGIHIGGDSREVVIADNEIRGGAGNGITLGSVRIVTIPIQAFAADPDAAIDEATKAGGLALGGFKVSIDAAGCIHFGEEDPGPNDNDDGTIDVPISEGSVWRVHIARNRIEDCGANGIATFPLLPIDAEGKPAWDAIAVESLRIEENEIRGCIRREPTPIPPLQRLFACPGAISLSIAIDVSVRDNWIEDNGLEPMRAASGVFVGYGEGVRIERNRIERTGGAPAGVIASTGGIVVRTAMGGAPASNSFFNQTTDRPALIVQGNIVHAPGGRALKALAMGPVIVTGNRLTGANPSSLFANPLQSLILLLLGAQSARDLLTDPANPQILDLALFDAAIDVMGGDAVSLVNLSFSEEFLLAYSLKRATETTGGQSVGGMASTPGRIAGRFSAASFRGGETLFADNQVSLRGGPASPAAHVSSVLILTLDDLGFADNQCELEADVAFSIADALLVGTTLRVTANRLQEAALCFGSLMSLGLLMNTTAHNQSTFLTVANCSIPAKLVDTPNLTMI